MNCPISFLYNFKPIADKWGISFGALFRSCLPYYSDMAYGLLISSFLFMWRPFQWNTYSWRKTCNVKNSCSGGLNVVILCAAQTRLSWSYEGNTLILFPVYRQLHAPQMRQTFVTRITFMYIQYVYCGFQWGRPVRYIFAAQFYTKLRSNSIYGMPSVRTYIYNIKQNL